MSVEQFNKLVKLVARAFYDDFTTKGENQPKTGRSDNRGMAVVVLDSLTKHQWVREEDLAKSLKLHTKQLRRTLRFFEEEKLVTRDHRRETAKGAKVFTGDGRQTGKEGDEKMKMHTHSYCCLDYAQIYDVVRYRMHRMKKKLKDELDSRNTVQEYICPNCKRRYSAFDALQLVSPNDEYFHCENCNGELVAESDKLAAEEMGDGDDNSRRCRREKLKDLLQKMEVQLKQLINQIAIVKDMPVPEFGTLQTWEARVSFAAHAANGDSSASDPSTYSQGQAYGGTTMQFLGETKVEVTLPGADVKNEGAEPDVGAEPRKALPPWMIKQSMVLTREQRGEVKTEIKMDSNSANNDAFDDKKPRDKKEDTKNIQEEFLTAYYAAILKRQQECEGDSKQTQEESEKAGPSVSKLSNGISSVSSGRQVGMKVKREDDDDGVEWDEAAPTGLTSEVPRVTDLNVQADASGDDDDDGIDWEEG